MAQLKVLKPTTITDAKFVSCTVTESEYPTYASSPHVSINDYRIYKHRIWRSLQNVNNDHVPDDPASDLWWVDTGPTNLWAQFDSQTSTETSLVTSGGSPKLVTSCTPGICNGVSVIGASGIKSATVTMVNGATTVFTQTIDKVDSTYISDWYMYFFEPYVIRTDLIFGPLPPYPSAVITVELTPSTVGDTVTCGSLLFGNTVEIGEVEYDASVGIVDYSRVETDEFGVTTLVKRNFAKEVSYPLRIDNTQLRRIFSTLADLRATPAVWSGSDEYDFSPLTVFGVIDKFRIEVKYVDVSICTLQIKGMT